MEYKTCKQCKIHQTTSSFSVLKAAKDGLSYTCKSCDRVRRVANYSKNKEREISYQKEYYRKNKLKIASYNRVRKQKNKVEISKYNAMYYKKNRDIINKRTIKNNKLRYLNNPQYRAAIDSRASLRKAIRNNHRTYILNIMKCSVLELKNHLESLFLTGMTWDNYGSWHVDHKNPLKCFNLLDAAELAEAYKLDNLQPLWSIDNLKKGSKYAKVKK